jgi:hypothetical protein
MKKLSIALLFAAITFSASAQRGGGGFHGGGGGGFHGGGGFYHGGGFYRQGIGIGFGYPYFYSPFYYPYGYRMPSKLELQIQDIKNDYNQRIRDAKHARGIPRSERRKYVAQLEHDRDQAIINAQRDYFNSIKANDSSSNNDNIGYDSTTNNRVDSTK